MAVVFVIMTKAKPFFCKDQKADRMFVLVSGKVVIAKVSASGKKSVLTCIETVGDLFGEIYLFIGKKEFEMEAQGSCFYNCFKY